MCHGLSSVFQLLPIHSMPCVLCLTRIKVKVAHALLPSVGFRFLAVSLQVTWVINPAVSCHYFPPGLQLPSQPLRGLLSITRIRANKMRRNVYKIEERVGYQVGVMRFTSKFLWHWWWIHKFYEYGDVISRVETIRHQRQFQSLPVIIAMIAFERQSMTSY